LDRIDVLLSTITDPAFTAVIRAEPLALSGTPVLAYCTDSTVGAATVATLDMGGGLYRTATIPFDIQIYEEINIVP
jgi:hypothetical protein